MTPPAGTERRGCALGIDVGSVRVGVAAGDETWTIASPVATIAREPRTLWPRIAREIEARQAGTVVVGLPRMLDGTEAEAAADARRFATELERRTGVRVLLWDERFTTVQAERALVQGGVRRRRRREIIDSVAASLLLQSWLDAAATRVRGADR